MTITPPVITIDGPSGAGKGTLCRALAKQLGWHLLDSGLLYRLLALIVIRQSMDVTVEKPLVVLAEQLAGKFVVTSDTLQVSLAAEDVTQQLASEQVGRVASQVAALPGVRAALLQRQRAFRQFPGLIADGRDMGSVVFPDAAAKIFLYASLEERTSRRERQLQEKGFDVKFAQVLKEIRERDYNDTHRRVAALAAAEGALLLDSTAMSLEKVIECALCYIQQNITINLSGTQAPTTGSVGP